MSEKLNILFVEAGSGKGGSAKSLLSMLSLLKREPLFNCAVLCESDTPMQGELAEMGIRTYALPGVSKAGYLPNLSIIGKIMKILKDDQYDLLYLNNDIHSHMNSILAGRVGNVPMVMHLRGIRAWTRKEALLKYSVKKYVAVSESAKAQAVSEGVKAEDIQVVYNMVQSRFEGASSRNEQPLVIANLNRWAEGKGHDYFFDSMCEVKQHLNDMKIYVLEPEDRSEAWVSQILNSESVKALSENIEFVPWRSSVAELLSQCHILINPSQLEESFGRLLVEGMQNDCLVFAADSGAHREILNNGDCGILHQAGDAKQLAGQVLQHIESPADFDSVKKAAVQRGEEFAREEPFLQAMKEVLMGVTGKRLVA